MAEEEVPTEATEETTAAPDTEELYDLCKTAEKALEKVATGLGQLGAAPEAVEQVSKIADVVEKICAGLAKGMKEEDAAPAHTMDSAASEMMAERRAAREAPPQA